MELEDNVGRLVLSNRIVRQRSFAS